MPTEGLAEYLRTAPAVPNSFEQVECMRGAELAVLELPRGEPVKERIVSGVEVAEAVVLSFGFQPARRRSHRIFLLARGEIDRMCNLMGTWILITFSETSIFYRIGCKTGYRVLICCRTECRSADAIGGLWHPASTGLAHSA